MLNQSTQGFHSQKWSDAVTELSQRGADYVLVTLLGTAGSTPRGSGTKMVITGTDIYDTVGGGHLEFKVIERARELLIHSESLQTIEHFPLGASLGQCCGGSVAVLFEVMQEQVLAVDLYGAGHVAHALIPILSGLPVQVHWIDPRKELFPENAPANITTVADEDPVEQVKLARPGTAFLVLTHNHSLDFDLCEAVLKRGDSAFLGVIGSDTKAKRFRMRLAHKGFSEEQIQQMKSPIGLENISGKLPMEVAVSIAGEIINLYQKQFPQKHHAAEGVQWRQIKQSLIPANVSEQEDVS